VTTGLAIAVEAHWKGTVLDALRPVVTLPLLSSPDTPDLLTIGEPFVLTLGTGQRVTVWCARTAIGRYDLEIKAEGRALLRTEANAPISANLLLRDEKYNQFSIRVEA